MDGMYGSAIKATSMKKENWNYEANEVVNLRVPLLPYDIRDAIDDKPLSLDRCRELIRGVPDGEALCVLFEEGLQMASPGFYERLKNEPAPGAKLQHSLKRYLLRACCRPTPFGTFAAVGSLVSCRDPREPFVAAVCHVKRYRADGSVLWDRIRRIEEDGALFHLIRVRINGSAMNIGTRVYYWPTCELRDADPHMPASIRATGLIRFFIEALKSPLALDQLISMSLKSFSKLNAEVVSDQISQLIGIGFLITDVRPSLIGDDPERKLERFGIREDKVPGAAMRLVQRQLDIGCELSGSLPESIGNDVAAAAGILLDVSTRVSGSPVLRAYRERFVGEYGSFALVPVLDLINPLSGLGSPYSKINGLATSPGGNWLTKRAQVLAGLLQEAVRDGRSEICLTAEDIDRLKVPRQLYEEYPEDLDILVRVEAGSWQDIVLGNYLIVFDRNVGALAAGRFAGRFMNLEKNLMADHFDRIVRRRAQVSGCRDVDLLFWPWSARTANVMCRPLAADSVIEINAFGDDDTTSKIELADIGVGIEENKFFLVSLRTFEKIRVRRFHMLNQEKLPVLMRFLMDVGEDGVRQLEPLNWQECGNNPFVPRLRYGKYVFSLRKWNFNCDSQGVGVNTKKSEARQKLRSFLMQWRAPGRICFLSGEGPIPIDTECDADMDFVIQKSAGGAMIRFEEQATEENNGWLGGKEGGRMPQMVFSVNRSFRETGQSADLLSETHSVVTSRDMARIGLVWIYFIVYVPVETENTFLVGSVVPILDQLTANGWIEKWFFVRYGDVRPHLRIRIAGDKEKLNQLGLPYIDRWLREEQEQEVLSEFRFESYKPEVSRYGGPLALGFCETIFCLDSRFLANYIAQFQKWAHREQLLFCAAFIGNVVDIVGADSVLLAKMEEQFKVRINQMSTADKNFLSKSFQGLSQNEFGEIVGSSVEFIEMRKAFESLIGCVRHHQRLSGIVQSIVHMHCNRLAGREADFEIKAIYVWHRLHNAKKYGR